MENFQVILHAASWVAEDCKNKHSSTICNQKNMSPRKKVVSLYDTCFQVIVKRTCNYLEKNLKTKLFLNYCETEKEVENCCSVLQTFLDDNFCGPLRCDSIRVLEWKLYLTATKELFWFY